MKMWTSIAIGLLFLVAQSTIAAELPKDKQKAVSDICQSRKNIAEYGFFPGMASRANEVWERYCEFGFSSTREHIDALLSIIVVGRDEFAVPLAPELSEYFVELSQQASVISGVPNTSKLLVGTPGLALGDSAFMVVDRDMCDETASRASNGASCANYVEEFADLFNSAQRTLSAEVAGSVATHLQRLGKEWDEFSESARSQTILESLINGRIFLAGNSARRFEPPPSYQLIVLHPSVALEYVGNSPDGSETKESILIEIAGVNWWRQDKWYIPSGGSVVTLYSNRPGIDDWGYGVALHFKNNLTIGYSDHDGEGGIFLSADLWKVFQDKKALVESYRGWSLPTSD